MNSYDTIQLAKIVTEWAMESDSHNDAFGMWCTVGRMYETGLCANCVVSDTSERWHRCPDVNCNNNLEKCRAMIQH